MEPGQGLGILAQMDLEVKVKGEVLALILAKKNKNINEYKQSVKNEFNPFYLQILDVLEKLNQNMNKLYFNVFIKCFILANQSNSSLKFEIYNGRNKSSGAKNVLPLTYLVSHCKKFMEKVFA